MMKSIAQQVRELNESQKVKPSREDLTLEITDTLTITDVTPAPKKQKPRQPKVTK